MRELERVDFEMNGTVSDELKRNPYASPTLVESPEKTTRLSRIVAWSPGPFLECGQVCFLVAHSVPVLLSFSGLRMPRYLVLQILDSIMCT